MSCRAAIRAKVGAIASKEHPKRIDETARYLSQAVSFLETDPPCLIAVGGTLGTGKSTLAHSIAPSVGETLGAFLVRSDVVRKQLLSVEILDHLPESAYDHQTTPTNLRPRHRDIGALIVGWNSVIADATSTNKALRNALKNCATRRGVSFNGIWLEAPLDLRAARIADRTNAPSDATVELIQQFRGAPDAPAAWLRLDAARDTQGLAQDALRQILT